MARRSGSSDIIRYSHLGIQFALVVLASVWIGARLDRKFSTSVFTLLGTFAGASIGFYILYRESRRASRPDGDGPEDAGRPDRDRRGARGDGRAPDDRARRD